MPIIGGNGLNSLAYIKNSGAAGEGTVVGAAWNIGNDAAANQKFIAAYKAKYNADPDQFAAQAYSGVYIIAEAIKKAGANGDRKSVRDALAGSRVWPRRSAASASPRSQRQPPAGGASGEGRQV